MSTLQTSRIGNRVTLESVVAQVKKEMHYPNVRFWAEYHPIIG